MEIASRRPLLRGNPSSQILDPATMEGSFLASSFHPPAAADSVGADPFRFPPWILIDKRACFDSSANATSKTVKTSTGHEVEISFSLANPPAVSRFCVHSSKIRREEYTLEPRVVSSAAGLLLLCFAFKTGPRSTDVDSDIVEFFVCKAGSGGNISIEPVPYSPSGTKHSWRASILPHEGGNFLVADLSRREGLGQYDLHVFSSDKSKWTTTPLQLSMPADVPTRDMPSQLDKVISLGETTVGWVDLCCGILFCDVLEKEPVLGFIPLPKAEFNLHRTGQPQKLRDVSCCDGFINFVEIQHCHRALNIVDTEDVVHDTCLIQDHMVADGWKIRTMFRRIGWDFWRKKHTVHVDDISADPEHTVLLPQFWTLRNLKTTDFPLFGVYSDNVVYLMSKVESDEKGSWIVGVDLENKKLEAITPYCAARANSCDPTVLPCAFSKYLDTTPRPYAELVAANRPQHGVLNNHVPSGDTISVASCAQNGVPDGHLLSAYTVPNNVQPQQNTWSVNGYYGSLNQSVYGAHPGYGNYQQPTPLQAQYVPPPNFLPTVQPMLSSTPSGFFYACWTDPGVHGRMSTTVPLNYMKRLAATPFAPSTPPLPAQPPFTQPLAPSQTFTPLMVGSYDVLSHGQQQHVKPFPSRTQGDEIDYSDGGEDDEVDYYDDELDDEVDYYG